MEDEVKVLVSDTYLICLATESCCATTPGNGICCGVCEDCVSGACTPKTDGTACGGINKCCGGVCSVPPCV
jgi:hypothetical protein